MTSIPVFLIELFDIEPKHTSYQGRKVYELTVEASTLDANGRHAIRQPLAIAGKKETVVFNYIGEDERDREGETCGWHYHANVGQHVSCHLFILND